MLQIPRDILFIIFSYISCEDQFPLKSVCVDFFSIVNTNLKEHGLHSDSLVEWKMAVQKIYPTFILSQFKVAEFAKIPFKSISVGSHSDCGDLHSCKKSTENRILKIAIDWNNEIFKETRISRCVIKEMGISKCAINDSIHLFCVRCSEAYNNSLSKTYLIFVGSFADTWDLKYEKETYRHEFTPLRNDLGNFRKNVRYEKYQEMLTTLIAKKNHLEYSIYTKESSNSCFLTLEK